MKQVIEQLYVASIIIHNQTHDQQELPSHVVASDMKLQELVPNQGIHDQIGGVRMWMQDVKMLKLLLCCW